MRLTLLFVFLFSAVSAFPCAHCVYTASTTAGFAIASSLGSPAVIFQGSETKFKTATTRYQMKNAALFVDTVAWKWVPEESPNPAIDHQFEHGGGNIRGMALSFKEFVPLDEFIEGFIGGMKEDAPETKLVERKDVVVNGVPMTEVVIDMPTDQAPIRYLGYIVSGVKGVSMSLAMCHRSLFDQVRTELKGFINGLVLEGATSSPSSPAPKKKK